MVVLVVKNLPANARDIRDMGPPNLSVALKRWGLRWKAGHTGVQRLDQALPNLGTTDSEALVTLPPSTNGGVVVGEEVTQVFVHCECVCVHAWMFRCKTIFNSIQGYNL